MRRSIEQLAVKQEQMAQNIATLQAAAQDIRQKDFNPAFVPDELRPAAQATEALHTFVPRAVAASASTTGRSAIIPAVAPGVALEALISRFDCAPLTRPALRVISTFENDPGCVKTHLGI